MTYLQLGLTLLIILLFMPVILKYVTENKFVCMLYNMFLNYKLIVLTVILILMLIIVNL